MNPMTPIKRLGEQRGSGMAGTLCSGNKCMHEQVNNGRVSKCVHKQMNGYVRVCPCGRPDSRSRQTPHSL